MTSGWIIGEYTGDPFKDRKVTFGTTACAGSAATVTVGKPVDVAIAIGSSDGADVRCTSTSAQLTGGTVIFTSDDATEKIHYLIVHKG